MPRVGNETLARAKAFLCWERFPALAVQLVQVHGAVAYFFAPHADRPAIVLFTPPQEERSEALFLLFHEAGHYLQYMELAESGRAGEYWRLVDCPMGDPRRAFEAEAWERGRALFAEFVHTCLPEHPELLAEFDACARAKLASYELNQPVVPR